MTVARPTVFRWVADDDAGHLTAPVLLELKLVLLGKQVQPLRVVVGINPLTNPLDTSRHQTDQQPNGPSTGDTPGHKQQERGCNGQCDQQLDDLNPHASTSAAERRAFCPLCRPAETVSRPTAGTAPEHRPHTSLPRRLGVKRNPCRCPDSLDGQKGG